MISIRNGDDTFNSANWQKTTPHFKDVMKHNHSIYQKDEEKRSNFIRNHKKVR
jgi:hypothetical protein